MCQGRRGDQLTTPSMELPSLWDPWVALQPGSFPCQGWKGVRHRGYTRCKFNMEMHYFVGLREARAAGGSGSLWIMQSNVLFVAARVDGCVGGGPAEWGVSGDSGAWGAEVSRKCRHMSRASQPRRSRKYVVELVQMNPSTPRSYWRHFFSTSSLLSPSGTP